MRTAAVVVCDVTREATFEAAARWKAELDQLNPELPVILVANKCDLLDDSTSSFIAGARMEAACRKHGFRGWYVTSAKLDLNIDQAMRGLLGHVEAKRREEEEEEEAAEGGGRRRRRWRLLALRSLGRGAPRQGGSTGASR